MKKGQKHFKGRNKEFVLKKRDKKGREKRVEKEEDRACKRK